MITLGPGFRPYPLILVGESQQAHAPYSKSRERVPEPAVTLLISYFFPEGVPVPDHTTPLLLRARREGAKKGRGDARRFRLAASRLLYETAKARCAREK